MDVFKRSKHAQPGSLPLLPLRPGSVPLPVLFQDLLEKVRNELFRATLYERYTLKSLDTLMRWCITSKNMCRDDLYRDVVTRRMGAPTGDEIEKAQDLKNWIHMFCSPGTVNNAESNDVKEALTRAVNNENFWYTMATNCRNDLAALPTRMCTAFLNSNNMQRQRWRNVFKSRLLFWLTARTEMGTQGPPNPHMCNDDEYDLVECFISGKDVTPYEQKDITNTLQSMIEKGWEFDDTFRLAFEKGLKPLTGLNYDDRVGDIVSVRDRMVVWFQYRMEFLFTNGVDTRIKSLALIDSIPSNLIDNTMSIHAVDNVYTFLKEKVEIIINNHILVTIGGHDALRVLLCAIVGWALKVQTCPEEWQTWKGQMIDILCKLVMYLASSTGCDQHEHVMETFEQMECADPGVKGTMLKILTRST